MAEREPSTTTLDPRFSSEGAVATAWEDGKAKLEEAELYWLSTVRPDGRPHVTPLVGAWLDGALHFVTGPRERKAMNLAANPRCAVTTGCNSWTDGMDVVLEGEVVRRTDERTLQRLQALYESKYNWHFDVRDGLFWNDQGGEAYVFGVAPGTAFGFAKGEPYSQTRWRFGSRSGGAN
jgi:general stress protein 26